MKKSVEEHIQSTKHRQRVLFVENNFHKDDFMCLGFRLCPTNVTNNNKMMMMEVIGGKWLKESGLNPTV